jgi:prephenate dehydratase
VHLRKHVSAYIYDPSKRFFHVVVELRNAPGALSSLLNVLQGMDLNILGSSSSLMPYDKAGLWSGFVEASDTRCWS